ncbi:unnamed protein product [Closterium sp. NIES-54]
MKSNPLMFVIGNVGFHLNAPICSCSVDLPWMGSFVPFTIVAVNWVSSKDSPIFSNVPRSHTEWDAPLSTRAWRRRPLQITSSTSGCCCSEYTLGFTASRLTVAAAVVACRIVGVAAAAAATVVAAAMAVADCTRATPPPAALPRRTACCRAAPPRTEPRRPAEPRRPTEPRSPAEPCCRTELCCPSPCNAPAATAASAAPTPAATMASPTVLTFDAAGRAVEFDVWVDDLQLFLQCDSRDGVSLFDHTSGVSTAPAATADSTVSESQPLDHWDKRA